MVQTIAPPADDQRDPRLRVLDPFVEQVRQWSNRPGDGTSIRFNQWSYSLDPPVARSIMRFCSGETGEEDRADRVVTQGVALLAKCMTDLCPSGNDDSSSLNDFYATQAELMLNVAVGTALIKETQLTLNELFADGRNDEARGLGRFQHDLRNMVLDVRRTIGEYERERAAILAHVFTEDTPSPEATAESTEEPPEEEEEVAARRPRRHTKLSPRSRKKREKQNKPKIILSEWPQASSSRRQFAATVVLAVLVAACAVLVGIRSDSGAVVQAAAAASMSSELGDVPEIERIQDRPPYVVLTAKQEFWAATAEPARLEWVRAVTQRAARSGYEGLVVRSATGQPLAEWVKGKQVRLVPAKTEIGRSIAGV